MPKKTSLAEDFIDVLTEIFLRLPWWVPLAAAGVLGGAVFIFLPEPFARQRSLWVGIAVVLIVLPGLMAQFERGKRRRLFEQNQELDKIRQLSWRQFEELVAEAFRRRGYSATITGGGGADEGVDVVLRQGAETVLVQCKHWKTFSVDVKKARELLGVVTAKSADKGILITSGRFTAAAKKFADASRLELIDGEGLVDLMRDIIRGRVPDTPSRSPDVPQVAPIASPLCPICNSQMVARVARQGVRAGESFWGCSRFPQCRGTRSIA